jgi:glutamyl-tRNA reductase
MIENIRQEKQLTEQERIQAGADRAAEEKRGEDARKKERIEAERRQLQEKIDDLKKRPTSRAYSQNLKNARIGEIEKQLDKLKNSPDEYFKNR